MEPTLCPNAWRFFELDGLGLERQRALHREVPVLVDAPDVDDVPAAKTYLESKGVKTKIVLPVTEGPAAGQTILYFNAPWGLQFKAISYPNGMAYEKDAETVLWSPKDPAK